MKSRCLFLTAVSSSALYWGTFTRRCLATEGKLQTRLNSKIYQEVLRYIFKRLSICWKPTILKTFEPGNTAEPTILRIFEPGNIMKIWHPGRGSGPPDPPCIFEGFRPSSSLLLKYAVHDGEQTHFGNLLLAKWTCIR